jgi:hypothetical protein
MTRIRAAALSAVVGLTACSAPTAGGRLCGCSHRWKGPITITLPAHLAVTTGDTPALCTGRPRTGWADVRAGAPVAVRDGAGRVLATWTLPKGFPVQSPGNAGLTGCRYTLTRPRHGIPVQPGGFELHIASHPIYVPQRHMRGNLFIDLPRRQYTRLTKIPRCSHLPRGVHRYCR